MTVGKMRKFWAIVYSMVNNSDVALQVVDARFPSICRSNQLEKYVQSHEKCNLLVALNKVDLILRDDQDKWINWFKEQEIDAVGISAKLRLGTVKIRKKILMASKKKRH